jgi:ABC-type uncharacterized transport system substrate-binding protein
LAKSVLSLPGRLLALALLLATLPGYAYENVTILVSTATPASKEFVDTFREGIAGQNIQLTVLDTQNLPAKPLADNQALIVAVGMQALQQAISLKSEQPILGVLIPQPAFEKIRSQTGNTNISAIFLDQPFSRQLRLLQKLLPETRTVGIPLGPTSRQWESALKKASKDYGLKAEFFLVEDAEGLTPALQSLLERTDVLLSVPDPAVHSRDTAHTTLLTSYRYRKAVIGYSQAYVTAGALAAPHSNPSHIARQAAEIAMNFPTAGSALPPSQAPQFFSISVNRQVARSLGIEIPDAKLLTQELTKEEP